MSQDISRPGKDSDSSLAVTSFPFALALFSRDDSYSRRRLCVLNESIFHHIQAKISTYEQTSRQRGGPNVNVEVGNAHASWRSNVCQYILGSCGVGQYFHGFVSVLRVMLSRS